MIVWAVPGVYWLALSTAGLIFSLAVIGWLHSQSHLAITVQPTVPPLTPAERISVIVPARNEERNIKTCIERLMQQTYPNYEVIVIDDRSSDGTPEILSKLAQQDQRLRVIQSEPLPTGWAGKPHALDQGARASTGDWLCFIDADTFASPDLLSATLAAAKASRADLFTIMTRQRLVTFWEKTIQPLIFTALSVGFSPEKVNDPKRPDAIANGQFLLFRREAYEKIGGHRAVANSIVEDRDLARKVKTAGLRLVVADGQAVAETRMYTNFREIWEGWTKNIYLGLSDDPGLAVLGVFGAVICLLAGLGFPGWLAAGIIWLIRGGGPTAGLVLFEGAAAFSVLMIVRAQATRAFGISPLYALTLPIGALIFGAMMAASTFQVLSGRGVTWKGRKYFAKE